MNRQHPTRLGPAAMARLRLIRLVPRAPVGHLVLAALAIPPQECPSPVQVEAQVEVREGSEDEVASVDALGRVDAAVQVADLRAEAAVVLAESAVKEVRVEPLHARSWSPRCGPRHCHLGSRHRCGAGRWTSGGVVPSGEHGQPSDRSTAGALVCARGSRDDDRDHGVSHGEP